MSQFARSKKTLKNIGLAAIVAASLFSAPALAQKQGLARETLEQLINVPSKDLSDDDLSLRILLNKRLVEDNVQQIAGIKLKPLLRADRREQKRRGNGQTASTSADDANQTADNQAPKHTNNPEANRQARDQLRDTRKAKALTIDELQERIAQSQAILDMGGIRLKRTNQLTSRLADDRKELANKKAALEQQRAAETAQKARNERLAAAEAERRAEEQRQAKAAADARRRADDARASREQAQQNGQANQIAREILRDNRPSRQLSADELNQRITIISQALSYPDMRRRLSQQLNAMLDRDQNALAAKTASRQAQPKGSSDRNGVNQIARGLLQDQRPADNLGLPELRDRVARTRDILQNTNLRQRLSNQLLDRLASDRDELRSRIAQRQGRRQNDRLDNARGENTISDQRPAFRLSDAQLDERIQKTGSILQRARLGGGLRRQLINRLADDRDEKRRRLLAARQERRQELRTQRNRNNGNGFSVDLGDTGITFSFGTNGVQLGSNPRIADSFNPTQDIIAAEVDDAAIQRQLLAPPRRNIQRSYSLNEFRARPDLRSIMPGIELDTIRFGTNEAFIGAEEIDNLDAIGEMIEQIVYARPDEVFVIEGHTDAVGTAEHNYGLSVARADAVRGALLDYFNISARNIVAIGYGERYLRIPTQRAEQENRRVSVRRITPLLTGQLR